MEKRGSRSGKFGASVIMGSDMVYEFYCEVCDEDGLHLEAEGYCTNCQDYLCGDCFRGHRSTKASRNHVLQDKASMPRRKPPVASGSKPGPGVSTEKCDRHPDRLVEYYCRDDRKLGCTVCMTMGHRKCEKLDHIPELSVTLLDSREYKQFTQNLTNLKSKSQDVIKVTKENVTKTDKWFNDAEARLREVRKKMNEMFDKCEGDLKKKANTVKAADIKKMKDIADKGQAVFDEVTEISADIQILQSKNQLGQAFIQMKKLEDRMETLHQLLTEMNADNSVTAYSFEPSTKIQEMINDPASIGTLTVQAPTRPTVQPSRSPAAGKTDGRASATQPSPASAAPIARDPRNVKAVSVGDINVKTKDDKKKCRITGSVLLPGNKLVLTDCNNSKVKLLNLQTSNITSELAPPTYPWNVTSIADDQVATTLAESRTIMFVKVTDQLKKVRGMSVNGKCYAIIHKAGKLIISYEEPVKIEIMSLDGTVERKIEQPGLFKLPSHISLTPGHDTLYVSDNSEKCVKRITLDGADQAVYKDTVLLSPRGITVDQQGRVLVCGGLSHNIHLLTADLAKVKVLIDGLLFPQSLSYCHNTGKLYVGMTSDQMKVYQLS